MRPRPTESPLAFQVTRIPFLIDLLASASAAGLSMNPVESQAVLQYLPDIWHTADGERWLEPLRSFLHYLAQRDPSQKLEILDSPIKTGDFVHHTGDGESWERLREGFNTPSYPNGCPRLQGSGGLRSRVSDTQRGDRDGDYVGGFRKSALSNLAKSLTHALS